MASPYSIAKYVYHALVPGRLRDTVYQLMPPTLKRSKRWAIQLLARTARHDEIYDDAYYCGVVEPTMAISAEVIAGSVTAELMPRTVVDVGCGTGLLLQALRRLDVAGIGLEHAEAGVAFCRRRGLNVCKFDIEHDPFPKLVADLVISTEVAEHLPASCADRFVDLLCHLAGQVVLTAAEPSVAGTDHVNEQPTQYWIDKFTTRGYRFEKDRSMRWRAAWREQGVARCFVNTVMVFRRNGAGEPANSE